MVPVLALTVAAPLVADRPVGEPVPTEPVLNPLMVPALTTVTAAADTP